MLILGRCCAETFLQRAAVFIQKFVQISRARRRPREWGHIVEPGVFELVERPCVKRCEIDPLTH